MTTEAKTGAGYQSRTSGRDAGPWTSVKARLLLHLQACASPDLTAAEPTSTYHFTLRSSPGSGKLKLATCPKYAQTAGGEIVGASWNRKRKLRGAARIMPSVWEGAPILAEPVPISVQPKFRLSWIMRLAGRRTGC